jgi:hypothetical protein
MAALHDIIAAYHNRLAEVTSPQVATAFLANMSDLAMKHLGFDKGDKTPLENTKSLLESLGMKLEIVKVGEELDFDLQCPFAKQVHPLIASKSPICPVTILILGAVRVKDRNSIPSSIRLNETGTHSVIEKNELAAALFTTIDSGYLEH